MKIALFTDTYLPQVNGVVTYISDSIKALSRENDVVLIAPGSGPLKIEQASKRVKIYWMPASPFPFYEGYRMASVNYGTLSAILKKEKPDVVHAHAPVLLGLQGIFASKRRGLPVVVTYHTHFPDYVPHLLSGKLPAFLNKLSTYTVKKLIKHVFRRVESVTAPTRELARELRGYGLRNVAYVPNGIDFSRFRCNPSQEKGFRKKHGIRKEKVVLYAGRISFEKRLEVLLEAYSMIEKKDRMLLVVGSGPDLARLRKLANGLGIKKAVFTGFVEKQGLAAAYRCADIFASASDTETFGLTFVEAMHAGVPAIGAAKFGAREIIENGRSGMLVKAGDVAGFADAMETLLHDDALRKRMARHARARAQAYSIEKSTARMLRIYRKLAGRKG